MIFWVIYFIKCMHADICRPQSLYPKLPRFVLSCISSLLRILHYTGIMWCAEAKDHVLPFGSFHIITSFNFFSLFIRSQMITELLRDCLYVLATLKFDLCAPSLSLSHFGNYTKTKGKKFSVVCFSKLSGKKNGSREVKETVTMRDSQFRVKGTWETVFTCPPCK